MFLRHTIVPLIALTILPGTAAVAGVAQPIRAGLMASPRERLESIAQRQREAADERAAAAPDPPGLESALGSGVSAGSAGPEARADLDAVLARALAMPSPIPSERAAPARPAAVLGATRLYVRAMQKQLDGDGQGAATDLESAVSLDPGSSELWIALGEAHRRLGREQECLDAMTRAVALGPDHPRPLLLVFTWETSRGRHEAALHLAARAADALGPRQDPALRLMVWSSLADTLSQAGMARAAGRAYLLGFDLPRQFPGGTAYVTELSAMYRSAWEALFEAGTLAVAAEDWETALEAFRRASGFQSIDDGRVLPPLVLAAMRLGRPAEAGVAIVDTIESGGVAADERTLRLIRHLRDHSAVGPLLAAALTDLDARVRGKSPSIEAAMARAVAAGLPDGLGRGPLAEAMERFPGSLHLATDLFESFGPDEMPRAIDAAVRLGGDRPVFAQTIADGMIAAGLRTPEVLDLLRERQDRPGATLLLARLLIESSRFEEARAVLDRAGQGTDGEPGEHGAALRFLGATLAWLSGDAAGSRRLIDSWPTPATDGERLLLVRSLQITGDLAGAADACGDPEPVDAAGRALLEHACQLARTRGDAAAAERLALRLTDDDPYSESGHAVLIALYSPGGPRADGRRLGEVVRELRDTVPSSPLLRFLSAREWMQVGRFADADTRLRALAEDTPEDDSVLRALIELWSMQAQREASRTPLDRGDHFLDRLARDNPVSLAPAAALAALRLSQGRPGEGVAAVDRWLDRGLLTTAEDRNRIRALAEPLLRRVSSQPDPASRDALLVLWDRMIDAGVPLDAPMHQARLVLLTQPGSARPEAIVDAAVNAADQVPSMDPGAFIAPIARLVQAGRPEIGLALLRTAAARPGGLPSDEIARWAGLVARSGGAQDLRDLLALTRGHEPLVAILRGLPGADDDPPTDEAPLRAEVAYAVGAAARILDRPIEVHEAFLALALELDPQHAIAANDLGYLWADRGERLDEAERLLEMAHRLRPDNGNIIDSLGWLRYKQGRLNDLPPPPQGGDATALEGAITLLERAVSLLTESNSPVPLDQLGDALWRAGRRDEAIARWREALPRAVQTVENFESAGAPAAMIAEVRARADGLERKIQAVDNGQEPPIAPLGPGVASAR